MNDFDDTEQALDRVEPAWADFQYGIRTGLRIMRDTDAVEKVRTRSLLDVFQELEGHRQRFEEGHPEALLGALVLALEENVPAPYWVSRETRSRIRRVTGLHDETPTSLHDAFELGVVIPITKKRWTKTRANLRREWTLWKETSRLMADGLALDPALDQVLATTVHGIGKTAARGLFLSRDGLQRALLKNRSRRNSTR